MLQTVFHSEGLPPEELTAGFDESTDSHAVRLCGCPMPGPFQARVRGVDLAGVSVEELAYAPSVICRHKRLVHPNRPDMCAVIFLLRGELTVAQAGREADLPGGNFVLYDNSQALEVLLGNGCRTPCLEKYHLLRLQVPWALVPVPRSGFGHLVGTRLPGRGGIGGLLTQFLASLAAVDPAAYGPGDAPRLGTVATDLLTAALAHHLDAAVPLPSASRRAAHLQGVQAYIQRHLGDPDLSPRTIAASHHISVSYVHRLFEGNGSTAAAWVREQRLERARRDLANPDLAAVPVHRIAARWGYTDHATFTRAFRAAFHVPPQAYRESALNGLPRER